jgi:hypothetical protein
VQYPQREVGEKTAFFKEVVAVKRFFRFAVCGFVSTILGAGAVSQAAQVVVVDPGQTASAGGWDITAPTGVVVVAYQMCDMLTVEKFADFTSTSPAAISFAPLAGATAKIDVVTEMITNESGSNWNGFTFSVSGGGATFDSVGRSFIPAFNPNPADNYSTINFSSTSVAYGGTQDNHLTSAWGGSDGSDLLIDTADEAFQFIEAPTAGSTPAVPLPSAALQALVGLGGLGLLATARTLKRRLLG